MKPSRLKVIDHLCSEDYTPLGNRLSDDIDKDVYLALKRVWWKYHKRLTRADFEFIVKETLSFRADFPLANRGKEWDPQ